MATWARKAERTGQSSQSAWCLSDSGEWYSDGCGNSDYMGRSCVVRKKLVTWAGSQGTEPWICARKAADTRELMV